MTTPVPNPAQRTSPYLIVRNATEAIEFYRRAFNATEHYRLSEPSGKVGHAELDIAGARLLLADEYPDVDARSPDTIGGTPVALHLYVENIDAVVKRAVDAGAKLVRPLRDEFFGDRTATLVDPFGHKWHLASRFKDVSPAEMQRAMNT